MSTNHKVVFIVTIMLVLLSISTTLNVALNLRDFAITNTIEKSNSIAQAVRDGLTVQMINGSLEKRDLFLENMIKHQNVKNLRVLRTQSVQEQFPKKDCELNFTQNEKKVLETKKSQTEIKEFLSGFAMNIAIPYIATKDSNPNCLSCHNNAKEGDILGVISMDIDMDSIKNETFIIITKIVFITLFFLILAIFITRYFIKPYTRLFEDLELGINKAYKGDFSYKVSTSLNNDAGKVAQRLNELSDIFKFKKTIESDISKLDIYNRLVDILMNYLDIKYFTILEMDNLKNSEKVIYKSDFKYENFELLSLTFNIDDNYSLILQIKCKSQKELDITREKIGIIRNYFDIAKPVIESKILMSVLKENSHKDELTELYNRRYLDEFVESYENKNKLFSILMLDIDFFKRVNDEYGHDMGDTVLKEISKIIKKSIRNEDFAIRFGGEEFLIFLFNIDPLNAIKKANNIKDEFSKKIFTYENESFTKTLSIGIAHHVIEKNTIWQTIKYADIALYKAKNFGRDKIVEFTNDMYKS